MEMNKETESTIRTDTTQPGRLSIRFKADSRRASAANGTRSLGITRPRDGIIHVPPGYDESMPMPLVVMLHGAGGNAQQGLAILKDAADAQGFILFAPESRKQTWDVIMGGYGPDVAYINRALNDIAGQLAIDARRVAIAGFSDGASYALSLGLMNGDVFSDVLAFSPGFMVPAFQKGEPRIFISHGERDEVLPINSCSRKIVPTVRRAGYEVIYHEFAGAHVVPQDVITKAVELFLKGDED